MPNKALSLALVGNPNVGKSVIFNYLTGMYVDVSNYPGTTIDIAKATVRPERNSSLSLKVLCLISSMYVINSLHSSTCGLNYCSSCFLSCEIFSIWARIN